MSTCADPSGIGSDHVDLEAAAKANITVAEVTYCNSISAPWRPWRRNHFPLRAMSVLSLGACLESSGCIPGYATGDGVDRFNWSQGVAVVAK